MHLKPKIRISTLALTLVLGLLATVVTVPSSYAQSSASPLVIPFQGQVTNQQNQLVASGQYSIIFNLYDVAVGGQPLWTERHSKVGVSNGMVNVFLGSITSMSAVDFSQTRYLGITIDVDDKPTTADPEMVPRQMIIPAFHAKNAEKLAGNNWSAILVAGATANDPVNGKIRGDKIADASVSTQVLSDNVVTTAKVNALAITNAKLADTSVTTAKLADASVTTDKLVDGSITSAKLSTDVVTPPGTVVAYVGDTAPTGWLMCNGAELPRASYPLLAALIAPAAVAPRFGNAANPVDNFKLPDFRGYFLRGVDGAAGRDPDKAARTAMAQGGAAGNAVGSVQADEFKSHQHVLTGINWMQSGVAGSGVFNDGQSQVKNQVSNPPVSAAGGSESRPKNAYVNYIIKY